MSKLILDMNFILKCVLDLTQSQIRISKSESHFTYRLGGLLSIMIMNLTYARPSTTKRHI